MPTAKKAVSKGQVPNDTPSDGLTDKERAFVAEFFRTNFNATQAYMNAFNPKKRSTARAEASKLLTKPCVSVAVAKMREEVKQKFSSSIEDIVKELELVAFARMGKFARVSRAGRLEFTETSELEADGLDAAIQSYTETVTEGGGSTGLRLHDKLKALEMLGKHRGMWTKDDGSGSTGDDSGTRTTEFGRVRDALRRARKGKR